MKCLTNLTLVKFQDIGLLYQHPVNDLNKMCNFSGLPHDGILMNELKLPYVTIHYEAPIIYLKFKNNAQLGFPEMKELVEYAEHLSNRTNYFILSDVRETVTVTLEGKKYALQSKNSPFQKGTAVWVKSPAYSLAANLFIGLLKPEFPYKVFTDEKEAKDWLLSLPLTDDSSHSC